MASLKKFASSTPGKFILAVIVIAAATFSILQLRNLFAGSSAAHAANQRIFICSETGKPFDVNLENLIGQVPPVTSPYSGKKTGYPAELCYWTSDGKPKTEPTPVLMNTYAGKPEPTFCPDCNRLVVENNPAPSPTRTAPATREEWMKRHNRT